MLNFGENKNVNSRQRNCLSCNYYTLPLASCSLCQPLCPTSHPPPRAHAHTHSLSVSVSTKVSKNQACSQPSYNHLELQDFSSNQVCAFRVSVPVTIGDYFPMLQVVRRPPASPEHYEIVSPPQPPFIPTVFVVLTFPPCLHACMHAFISIG